MVSGCGLLFLSSEKDILLDTEPAQAEIWIEGVKVGTTPMTISLSNREDHRITFRKDGFDDITCHLDRKIHNGILVLDILSGLVPVIVDAATGGWYRIPEDSCVRQLPPE